MFRFSRICSEPVETSDLPSARLGLLEPTSAWVKPNRDR